MNWAIRTPDGLAFYGRRPQRALVTEYCMFHDMDGLRFSNPKATLKLKHQKYWVFFL